MIAVRPKRSPSQSYTSGRRGSRSGCLSQTLETRNLQRQSGRNGRCYQDFLLHCSVTCLLQVFIATLPAQCLALCAPQHLRVVEAHTCIQHIFDENGGQSSRCIHITHTHRVSQKTTGNNQEHTRYMRGLGLKTSGVCVFSI